MFEKLVFLMRKRFSWRIRTSSSRQHRWRSIKTFWEPAGPAEAHQLLTAWTLHTGLWLSGPFRVPPQVFLLFQLLLTLIFILAKQSWKLSFTQIISHYTHYHVGMWYVAVIYRGGVHFNPLMTAAIWRSTGLKRHVKLNTRMEILTKVLL